LNSQFNSSAPPISSSSTNPVGKACGTNAVVLVYHGQIFTCQSGSYAAGASSGTAGPVDLASGVTGVLPQTNGGTGSTSPALQAGSNIVLSGTFPNYSVSAVVPAQQAVGYSGNQAIGGCGVEYVSGLTLRVAACSYVIAGLPYTSPLTTVTLTAANGTNDRIDVIGVDVTGAVFSRAGTPAANPAEPSVSPSTELQLRFVYIPAAATAPSNVATGTIFEDGTGGWTFTGSTGVATSTTTPFSGTTDISATNAALNATATFANGSTVDLSAYSTLTMYFRSKGAWPTGNSGATAARNLTVGFQTGATAKGSQVVLKDATFGINTANTTSYQQVSIPTSLFNANGVGVDTLKFTVTGNTGTSTIGFFLDLVTLQTASASSSSNVVTATPYDAPFSLTGLPAANTEYAWMTAVRSISFPANFAGAMGTVAANPTSTATFTIKKNGTAIGTVVIATNGTYTFATTNGVAQSVVAKDRLTVTSPTVQDATLSGPAFTITGNR
jgi:hypothetical protein